MKISHKKAFKFYIRSQRGQLDSKSEIRLSNHLETCGDCQHLISVENKVSQTKNWMNTGKSLDRESKTINAVQRDARRYLMFSRLSKNTKIFALSALLVLIMSSIILTKDNLLPVPAALQETQIVKEDEGEKDLNLIPIIQSTNTLTPLWQESLDDYYETLSEIAKFQSQLNFDIKVSNSSSHALSLNSYYVDIDSQNISFLYLGSGGGIPEILYTVSLSQQLVDSSKKLNSVLKTEGYITQDNQTLWESTKVNGNEAMYYRGGYVNDIFDETLNQWELVWLENDVLYRIQYSSNIAFSYTALIIFGENLRPLSEINLPKNEDNQFNVFNTQEIKLIENKINYYRVATSILISDDDFDLESKIPTVFPSGMYFEGFLHGDLSQLFNIQFRSQEYQNGDNSNLTISKQSVVSTISLENLIKDKNKIGFDSNFVWEEFTINGNQAIFIKGNNQNSELSWLINNTFYQITYIGNEFMPGKEMVIIGESLTSLSKIILEKNNILASLQTNLLNAYGLIAIQNINFEVKIPTITLEIWGNINPSVNSLDNSFSVNFRKENTNTLSMFTFSQRLEDSSSSLQALVAKHSTVNKYLSPDWEEIMIGDLPAIFYVTDNPDIDGAYSINGGNLFWLEDNILFSIFSKDEEINLNQMIIFVESLIPISESISD